MALTMGVDIGGTKVAAGVVDETGRVIATERRSSPSTSRQRWNGSSPT
jgi:glucokinase